MANRRSLVLFRLIASLATLASLFSGMMARSALAAPAPQSGTTTANLKSAHRGASNPGFQEGSCPADGWGWHFVLPGNSTEFVSIRVNFASGEEVTDFTSSPTAKHAYVYSSKADTIESATAQVNGPETEFVLSHVCAGEEPEATATPTEEPEATATPTEQPEATATPTEQPEATATPTEEPEATATPTEQPAEETATPTATPAPEETATPTATPTKTPTRNPSPVTECLIYAVYDADLADSQFLTISLQGNVVTPFGPIYTDYDIEGIDIDPATNLLYAVAGSDNKHGKKGWLFLVDGVTGELFPVGASGYRELPALSMRPGANTLWTWSEGDGLVQLNKATGAGTLSVSSGINIEGLAWNRDGSILYGVSGTRLYQITPGGGVTELANNLPGSGQAESLEVRPDGLLMGSFHKAAGLNIFAYDPIALQPVSGQDITTPYNDIESLAYPDRCGPPDNPQPTPTNTPTPEQPTPTNTPTPEQPEQPTPTNTPTPEQPEQPTPTNTPTPQQPSQPEQPTSTPTPVPSQPEQPEQPTNTPTPVPSQPEQPQSTPTNTPLPVVPEQPAPTSQPNVSVPSAPAPIVAGVTDEEEPQAVAGVSDEVTPDRPRAVLSATGMGDGTLWLMLMLGFMLVAFGSGVRLWQMQRTRRF